MVLFLTAFDKETNWHEFSCGLKSIEANFDFLSGLVAQGNTLVSACILEGANRTDLPLAAFDGAPLAKGIEALQQEWETILSRQNQRPQARPEERLRNTQRVAYYEASIAVHLQMIHLFGQWLERTQACQSVPGRAKLISCYERQVDVHQVQMANDYRKVALAMNQLNQPVA